jgi:hypothetical protein
MPPFMNPSIIDNLLLLFGYSSHTNEEARDFHLSLSILLRMALKEGYTAVVQRRSRGCVPRWRLAIIDDRG